MEAQEVRYNSIIDRLGENKEFIFTFNFPVNTTWAMVQESLTNMQSACMEFEEKQKGIEAQKEPNKEVIDVTQ